MLFLDRFRHELGRGPARFSSEAAAAIGLYHWPGNVRELRNAVERAVVLGQSDEVAVDDLGLTNCDLMDTRSGQLVSLDLAEYQHIDRVLEAVGGNKTRACQILGIGRGTLYKKLENRKSPFQGS